MSRIRDLGNILSGATEAATDVEVAAAISAHNSVTTSVHGISNTSNLATQDFVLLNKGVPSGTTAQRPTSFLSSTGDVYSNTTTGYLEIYSSTYGWEKVGANPSNLVVTPTNVGTARAFNNGAVEVDLGFPTIPGRTYTVTSTPTTSTYTSNTPYALFDGLQSSTQYTFTATATNLYGSSTPVTSSPVTVTTVPAAPTIGSATPSNNNVYLTWTAGATGGSAITGYTIYPFIGSSMQSSLSVGNTTSANISVNNGTTYTFKVAAINANGMSELSSASNSVTPIAGIPIEYLVLAGGGGAGTDYAGGGGSGGYRTNFGGSPIYLTSGSTYNITVGGGGYAGNRSNGSNGGTGSNSSISLAGSPVIESSGGGYGAQYWSTGGNGGSGGGGGGGYGGEVYNNGGSGNTPATIPSQGNNGGKGYGPNGYGSNRYGGGGGSPTANGTDSTSGSAGVGAAGISNSISGSSITYGRGGDGCTSQSAQPTRGATANRGEGGSGGGENIQGTAGSSGVVIIKAGMQASSTTGSPSNPSTGIYIFNGNGSITF